MPRALVVHSPWVDDNSVLKVENEVASYDCPCNLEDARVAGQPEEFNIVAEGASRQVSLTDRLEGVTPELGLLNLVDRIEPRAEVGDLLGRE